MIRMIVQRMISIRNYHGFKRAISPTDFDVENKKWTKTHITEPSFKEKGEKQGKDLYFPKYGASIYDDNIIAQFREQNSRED
jgi:hypothetical protein